jgi:hypothetical protein
MVVGVSQLDIRIESDVPLDTGFEPFEGAELAEGIEVSEVLLLSDSAPYVFTIFIARDVALPLAVGVVSSWLYGLVARSRRARVTVNRRQVETITRDGLERVIEETLEYRE